MLLTVCSLYYTISWFNSSILDTDDATEVQNGSCAVKLTTAACTLSVRTTYSAAAYEILTSIFDEMQKLMCFLNHQFIPTPLSHMKLYRSLSIIY